MANISDYFTSYFGWAAKAPPQLKELLNTQQIIELENLRKEFKIPQENFLLVVSMSIQLGRKIVKRDFDLQKKLWPNKCEKDVLRYLLVDDLSKDPELAGNTQKDLEQVVVLADEAMKRIDTLGELCDYLGSLEYQSNLEYYNSTLAQRIDDIIGGKKTIQCLKCSKKLTIPYYYVSKEGTCPRCGESISLPYGFQPRTANHDMQEDEYIFEGDDQASGQSERIPCRDGGCVGVINKEGFCGVCGKPYSGRRF